MNILDFFGHFHPLLLHLPIGILVLFIITTFVESTENPLKSIGLLRLMLLVSAVSATLSVITGLIQGGSGDYDLGLITNHKILGIALMLVNWVIFIKLNALLLLKKLYRRTLLSLVALLLILTGHAGGSLAHGSDFLTPPPLADWFSANSKTTKVITMDSPVEDVVLNIFHEKCVSCHGTNKQKGDLQLDSHEAMLKTADASLLLAENSLLLERVMLPLDDEDHMPPQGKKQLSKTEIDFLSWWIMNGATVDKSLAELKLPSNLHGLLTELIVENPLLPQEPISPAPAAVIGRLQKLGVGLLPVAQNSNYLMANLVNTLPENASEIMTELSNIKAQLIWLNMDFQSLTESDWQSLGQLTALRKLSLKETNFNDEQMDYLKSLPQLVHLNLSGTQISDLSALENLPNLQALYLYNSKVATRGIEQLTMKLPLLKIDIGNYQVPVLASDTTEFTKTDLK
jgi:hypothetical protein